MKLGSLLLFACTVTAGRTVNLDADSVDIELELFYSNNKELGTVSLSREELKARYFTPKKLPQIQDHQATYEDNLQRLTTKYAANAPTFQNSAITVQQDDNDFGEWYVGDIALTQVSDSLYGRIVESLQTFTSSIRRKPSTSSWLAHLDLYIFSVSDTNVFQGLETQLEETSSETESHHKAA